MNGTIYIKGNPSVRKEAILWGLCKNFLHKSRFEEANGLPQALRFLQEDNHILWEEAIRKGDEAYNQ